MDRQDPEDRKADLEMAIALTEATIRYCDVPATVQLYKACLVNYRKELEKVKKELDIL